MTQPVTAPGTAFETDRSGRDLLGRARSMRAMITFFALAFAWSWAIGFAAIGAKANFPVTSTVLSIMSGFGPSLAGLAVVRRFSGRTGLRDWLTRCLAWRVGWHWFLLAFLLPPSVMLIANSIHIMLGGSPPAALSSDKILLAILNFGLVLLIGGPLGEEFGWRGYAMPALAARCSLRATNLIVGALWGLWHLPLFFSPGAVQSVLPIMTFMINILAGSIVFGWLWERTKGSVLPALVMHTSLNAWAGILGIIPSPETSRPYALVARAGGNRHLRPAESATGGRSKPPPEAGGNRHPVAQAPSPWRGRAAADRETVTG
jgi:membrane protease YdiL (CAAX protease family)